MKTYLLLLGTLLVFAGCRSTYRAFDGESTNAVVLKVAEEIRVTEVDGKKVGSPVTIELLPGKHEIKHFVIMRTYQGEHSERHDTEMGTIEFTARAKHVYQMDYDQHLIGTRLKTLVAIIERPANGRDGRKLIAIGKPDSAANSRHK